MGMQHVAPLIANDQYNAAMRETWGHLAPEANTPYLGRLLFVHTEWGQTEAVRSDFGDLPDSPWFYEHMQQFLIDKLDLSDHCLREGCAYFWEGTYMVKVTPGEKPDDWDPDYDCEPDNIVEPIWEGILTEIELPWIATVPTPPDESPPEDPAE